MQVLICQTPRGLRWLIEGFALFRKKPLYCALSIGLYGILMLTLPSLPILIQLIVGVCIPSLSVVLLTICRKLGNEPPRLRVDLLATTLRKNARALLLLGIISLAIGKTTLALVGFIDDGVPFARPLPDNPEEMTLIGLSQLSFAEIGAIGVFTLTLIAYWFAPILVTWHQFPVGKALFFSFAACLRNWRAFLAYFLYLLLAGASLPLLTLPIMSMSTGLGVSLLFALFVFIALPVTYASIYISYRDIFHWEDGDV